MRYCNEIEQDLCLPKRLSKVCIFGQLPYLSRVFHFTKALSLSAPQLEALRRKSSLGLYPVLAPS